MAVVDKTFIGSITLAGSGVNTYTSTASPETQNEQTDVVKLLCDTSTGIVDFTLPEISTFLGKENVQVLVFDSGSNATANDITIRAAGSDLINGAATLVISTDDLGATLVIANGTNWMATVTP